MTEKICPKCGINPRPLRNAVTKTGGTHRGTCRSCESKQKAEYYRTEAGKDTSRRYLESEKGRVASRRAALKFYYTEKGQAVSKRKDEQKKALRKAKREANASIDG